MKFVRKGNTLYIDKQILDDSDILDRLQSEIAQAFALDSSMFKLTKKRFKRETLTIVFPSIEVAKDAEKWFEDVFEA